MVKYTVIRFNKIHLKSFCSLSGKISYSYMSMSVSSRSLICNQLSITLFSVCFLYVAKILAFPTLAALSASVKISFKTSPQVCS